MKKTKRYFAKRAWLNKDVTARATMSGVVSLTLRDADPTSRYEGERLPSSDLDASLSFADCTRTATLEFDVWGGDTADRREKLRRLRTFVNDWCTAYEKALDAVDAHMAGAE